jgi:succinylglutamic semialdehyde dehydrogenase
MEFELKGNYFNNQYHQPIVSGPKAVERFIERECPSNTNLQLWNCPVEYRHLEEVIASVNAGFSTWRKTKIEQRIDALKRFQENVLAKKETLARAIALEIGKPYWEALTEVGAVIAKVDVTIEHSLPRINSKSFNKIDGKAEGQIHYKPIGPCLVIGPFNFPCHLANGQILSALISGNSIIFKPSEKACYSSQILMDCFAEANFPAGVINLIQGDGEMARRLVAEKTIKGIFFTGSKEVGKKIISATSTDLSKLVSLELGGKNTTIVHKDASVDTLLPELLNASFLTTGQRCTSTAIVAIHRSLQDEVVERFHQLSKRIIVDHATDHEKEPFMGPLVDQRSMDSYLLFMGMAKREGIETIMRGKQLEREHPGYYVSPSIHLASKWDNDSHFLSSEIFGPNCTFIPYDDIDEAIEMANSTEYGLASALFSQDEELFNHCVQNIDAGIFNFNRSTIGANAKLPFGGVKNSGNYRPAAVTTIDSCVYQMACLKNDHTLLDSTIPTRGISEE